jgi:hypothetical protein
MAILRLQFPSLRFRVSRIPRALKNRPGRAHIHSPADRQLQKKNLPKTFQHVPLNFWVD